jgi:hypothetical protein
MTRWCSVLSWHNLGCAAALWSSALTHLGKVRYRNAREFLSTAGGGLFQSFEQSVPLPLAVLESIV